MLSAPMFIQSMSHTVNIGTARILTAVSTVLAPQADGDEDISKKKFCNMLGFNCNCLSMSSWDLRIENYTMNI